MRQPKHVSDLVGHCPDGSDLRDRGAKDVIRVRGAAIEDRAGGPNEMGHHVELSHVIAVIEELNLLACRPPAGQFATTSRSLRAVRMFAPVRSSRLATTTPIPAVPYRSCMRVSMVWIEIVGLVQILRCSRILRIGVQPEDCADVSARDIRAKRGATLRSDNHSIADGHDETVFRIEGHPGPGEFEPRADVRPNTSWPKTSPF